MVSLIRQSDECMQVFVCTKVCGNSKFKFYHLVINHILDKNTTKLVKKPVNSNKVNFLIAFVSICTIYVEIKQRVR